MFSWAGVECLETNNRSVPGRSSAASWRCLQALAILFYCCSSTILSISLTKKTHYQRWRTPACYIILPTPWYSSSEQTTVLLWVIWKVSGSVSFQEQTIKTGYISTSHFKLQEALMSQGNNFLFIYLQMPSRMRIQPVHLLSQKPCGSSQPVLDVTACSCPGWLLARGQPWCEQILTLLFRELEMLHEELDSTLTSPFPNARHCSLSKAGCAH